jgi:hypothetical protein
VVDIEPDRQATAPAPVLQVTDLTPPMHRQDTVHPLEVPDPGIQRLVSQIQQSVMESVQDDLRKVIKSVIAVASATDDAMPSSPRDVVRSALSKLIDELLPDSEDEQENPKKGRTIRRMGSKAADDNGSYRAAGESLGDHFRNAKSDTPPAIDKAESPNVLNADGNQREILIWIELLRDRLAVGWSGRIWVGGIKYEFTPAQRAGQTYLSVRLADGAYVLNLHAGAFPSGDFPDDTEYYDLANTHGDIHCERF